MQHHTGDTKTNGMITGNGQVQGTLINQRQNSAISKTLHIKVPFCRGTLETLPKTLILPLPTIKTNNGEGIFGSLWLGQLGRSRYFHRYQRSLHVSSCFTTILFLSPGISTSQAPLGAAGKKACVEAGQNQILVLRDKAWLESCTLFLKINLTFFFFFWWGEASLG